jgi:branched-chain amino acid transport system substrate-binding protein
VANRLLQPAACCFAALFSLVAPFSAAAADPPEEVKVGLYWNSVPSLDLRTDSFSADFYLWFLWRGELDPTREFEFTNVVEPNNLVKNAAYTKASGEPEPQTLPDGTRYQAYHVQGRFSQAFALDRFPLDHQRLVISLEDLTYDSDRMRYIPDREDSASSPGLGVNGWRIERFFYDEILHTYNSRFGDSRIPHNRPYSRVEFGLVITRPIVGLLSKTVLPISIIILITFGAFFCRPDSLDARLGLTMTSLIAAVALWYTTAFELPPVNYLLLIDKIYIFGFLAILATTAASIISSRLARSKRYEVAERMDYIAVRVLMTLYFGGIALLVVV